MSADLYTRLAAIMLTIALGALLTRVPALRAAADRQNPAAVPGDALAQLAIYVLVPALMFRTMARMDLAHLPWQVVQAYFVPVLACTLLVYAVQRGRAWRESAAAPATRATAAVYGNSVQMGIPLVTALFGEAGLAIHIALVSLHGVLVLTTLTLLAEFDLSRAEHSQGRWDTLVSMLRSTLVHPVVLPVLLGLSWNLLGLPLPSVIDQVLAGLGVMVVPLCLLLIGMSLAHFGLRGHWRQALPQVVFKLLLLPLVVLLVARFGFGLQGLALQVAVMMAALPIGSNALIFAQRYRVLQAEATAGIVLSTCAFALTVPLWLWVISQPG